MMEADWSNILLASKIYFGCLFANYCMVAVTSMRPHIAWAQTKAMLMYCTFVWVVYFFAWVIQTDKELGALLILLLAIWFFTPVKCFRELDERLISFLPSALRRKLTPTPPKRKRNYAKSVPKLM